MKTRRFALALAAAGLLTGPAGAAAQEFGELRGRSAMPHLAAHRPPVPGPNGLVTSGHPLASTAGVHMLMQGGNGFMTIYDRTTDRVYNLGATGAAPRAIRPAELTPEQLNTGIKAGVVPGLFGGWIEMLDRFGTMSLAQVLEPAIGYAEHGHPFEASVARAIGSQERRMREHPTTARVFLPGGRVPVAGELFRMPDLANTLTRLVEAEKSALAQGKSRSEALRAAYDLFYRGDLAREMAAFYGEIGGDFRYEDFASYEPSWAEPVHTSYRGYDVYSSPPTSRGGMEVAMQLNLVEGFDLKAMGHNSAEALHLVTEAIKVAKADIYRYVADPNSPRSPVALITSKEFAAQRRSLIQPGRAIAFPVAATIPTTAAAPPRGEKAFPVESWAGSTTDFSVADRFGNVIAGTPTHGGSFGTGVVVGNTGILFNNGTRIGSTSPYPEDVNYVRALEGMGHTVRLVPGFSLGSNSGIIRDALTGSLLAGADPRRLDYAVGF